MSLLTDVQMQLDESQGPVFWVIEQLYDAINEAQFELYTTLKDWQRVSAVLAVGTGQDLISLPNTSIMIPQFVVYNGIKIFPTTTALLQDWQNNWKNEGLARPNWMVLWDADHLRLFPRSDASYNFNVWGTPWPTQIQDGTHDITGIDPLVKKALVLRAAALLLEETQPALADAKVVEAYEFEHRFARQQRNSQGSNITRLRPGVAWDVAQQGDIIVGRQFLGSTN